LEAEARKLETAEMSEVIQRSKGSLTGSEQETGKMRTSGRNQFGVKRITEKV